MARLDQGYGDRRTGNLIRLSAYALLPEVGARCGSSACRDLCGGCGATRIPTATLLSWGGNQR